MMEEAEPKMSVSLFTSDDQAAETGDKAYFTILRGVPLPGHPDPGLTVNYTISGSATPSSDYVALSGSVFILPVVGSIEIAVEPLDDPEKESAETVIMTLQAGLK
jgi:hypothetical protein